MILLGLVTCAIFMGMPYLVENMDPEMKAEWEESQKANPMNSLMGAATGQAGANPVGNFDMAAFLAGSTKKEAPAAGGAGGNGKKAKR
jgi:O-acetylhomoserine/O-acetylserine sulfhydrylase